ncbi:MAG: carbamoyl phosphate synthase small subunit, partial [Ruminiclostridium sp.]|nr:carbamoyl phosphate synthase small subunit [Ruminiclostridium sp.]
IGNYGTNDEDYESRGSVVSGYIVREYCEEPSNFRCEHTIDEFLKKYGIIGLYDIDTRRLTRKIRESGVMNGMITNEPGFDKEKVLEAVRAYNVGSVVPKVSVKAPEVYKAENAKYRIALIDYGYKYNIRRELLKRGCDVTVFPYDVSPEEIKSFAPDGIMLSNGPGDPAENKTSIATLKALIPERIPTFGICLGHQLLALANGAATVKMKYGHRGGNQPVTDLELGRTFITSQNHGYAVVADSIPESAGRLSHVNANDKTCEGVRYTNAPAFTVQFHPEACGGPHDTAYLFDEFIEMIGKERGDR